MAKPTAIDPLAPLAGGFPRSPRCPMDRFPYPPLSAIRGAARGPDCLVTISHLGAGHSEGHFFRAASPVNAEKRLLRAFPDAKPHGCIGAKAGNPWCALVDYYTLPNGCELKLTFLYRGARKRVALAPHILPVPQGAQ